MSLLCLAAFGCGSPGNYIWYSELPKSEWNSGAIDYVIQVGDVINIRVYEQEPLSGSLKIRKDGRIALPLAGELVVAGKRPSDLAKEIEEKLKTFIVSPRVTINIETSQPITVTAVGEIAHVGPLTLDNPAQLIQAIAQAGGLNDYANKSRVFVMRQFPQFQRIRFTYDAILHNEGGAATFPMRTGDVIIIE